jgi:hypothetical protein
MLASFEVCVWVESVVTHLDRTSVEKSSPMPEEGLEPPDTRIMIARLECGGVRAVTGFRC